MAGRPKKYATPEEAKEAQKALQLKYQNNRYKVDPEFREKKIAACKNSQKNKSQNPINKDVVNGAKHI